MSDNNYYQKDASKTMPFIMIIGVIALLSVLAWIWLFKSPGSNEKVLDIPRVTEVPQDKIKEAVVEAEPLIEEPAIDEPVLTKEPVEQKKPLPALNNSDEPVKNAFNEFSVGKAIVKMLVPERIILKTVRAVLALEEGNVVKDFRPIKSPEPSFKVAKIDEPIDLEIGQRYRISSKNYERYENYIDVFAKTDKQKLAGLYKDFYPLFEEAYSQYGVDKGGFDKVLNRVIDRIIASEVHEKIKKDDQILIQPKVFYTFQDKRIENLSSIDKLLLRIGKKNTLELQKQLQAFKREIQ